MKKVALVFLLCFLLLHYLHAQEAAAPKGEAGTIYYWDEEDEELVNLDTEWVQERGFEIGIIINDFHIANNVFSLNQLLSKVIYIDLNKIPEILQMQLGIGIMPLFFNYDSKEGWGFGIETGIQAIGFLGLNADLPILKDANNKKSDLGAAAFVNISPNGFFHVNDFRISVKPTLFFPAVYTKSLVYYTLNGEQTHAEFIYDINIYMPVDADNNFSMPLPGVDLTGSVEYPLSQKLNLTETHPLLNFDVGASITALPLLPGTMKNYERVWGNFIMTKNNGIYIASDPDKDEEDIITKSDGDSESLTGSKSVFRPFNMHFWADWRPLGTELVTVTPLIGFAVNSLYIDPVSLEIGISGLLNLNNLFYTKLGINRFDRMWINSMDFAFNLRALEIILGLNLRSQEFLKSWNFSGFGFGFGLIFGW